MAQKAKKRTCSRLLETSKVAEMLSSTNRNRPNTGAKEIYIFNESL